MADEHRYGRMSVVRKVWTLRGHQPKVPHQSRYEWGYLHAALEVGGSGGFEAFFSSTVGLDLSTCFLEQLAESDPQAEHIVIWDGAGFHPKAGRHPLPERVHVVQLPPYRPELNPAEKLFDQLKDALGNQLFATLEEIEAAILESLEEFWQHASKVNSLIGAGWLLAQTNSSARSYRPVIS